MGKIAAADYAHDVERAVRFLNGQAQEVMGEIEAGPGRTLAASRAWAVGDVGGALGAERSYERCIAVTPGALTFDARVKRDLAKDIETALKSPGHAIAVAPLRTLLAQGGVLDQLRAKGYTVERICDACAAD